MIVTVKGEINILLKPHYNLF